ncbi:unnamed protein product [Amoebophrya sp. A120]|nr:unnamed protein product [Amoebophrya sp. A120]|eukprot:GSA120T00011561001.1
MAGVIANQPVVLDNGSGVMKAGVAGDEQPKCVFSNYVGRPKHERVMAGAAEGEVFIGESAEHLRGLLTCNYPVEHGIVNDWLEMEQIWHHVYNEMKIASEEHPVLLTEAPLNPHKNREKAAEIFFESFNSPALFVSAQAILSLYASGRTTGVVLDSGDGVTHVVPVYEGFALGHAIQRMDVAGRDVTNNLMLQLRRHGHIFHTSAEREIVREMKERICYVAFNPAKEETSPENQPTNYKLPDGQTINLAAERFRAPELLFQPNLIGLEYPGVHEQLFTAISRADLDLRKTLYSQIVLSGGSTMFAGYGDRLLNEMRKLVPKDCISDLLMSMVLLLVTTKMIAFVLGRWTCNFSKELVLAFCLLVLVQDPSTSGSKVKKKALHYINVFSGKIRISAPPNRQMSTWTGGSILASLATFKSMWVSREEYDEEGPGIMQRKTF